LTQQALPSELQGAKAWLSPKRTEITRKPEMIQCAIIKADVETEFIKELSVDYKACGE